MPDCTFRPVFDQGCGGRSDEEAGAPPDLLRTCWTALPWRERLEAPHRNQSGVRRGGGQRGGARLVRLRVDDEGLVATLELDDPARFNTMSAELGADLASHCSQRPLS